MRMSAYAQRCLEGLEIRLFYILIMTHFMSCVWVYLGKQTGGWVELEVEEGTVGNDSNFTLYLAAFHTTMTCLTSVGYGEITGGTQYEMMFMLQLELIGMLLYVAILWDINQLIALNDNKEEAKVGIIYIYIYI